MFESTPEMLQWLAGRVGDAAGTLQDRAFPIVPQAAFGDTGGGVACAVTAADAVETAGTATGRLVGTLRSDVDGLREVAANYLNMDGASGERIDSIDVYTTHVTGGHPNQISDAWDVVNESEGRPTVFSGNFNTRLECPDDSTANACDPGSRAELGRFDELGFTDAGADAGPTDGNGHRIDYVLTNGLTPPAPR